MIPKPFTQIVVAIGEPVNVDRAVKDLLAVQLQMEAAINTMMVQAQQQL